MDEQEPTPTENESNDAPGEARRVGWALLALEGIASGTLALVLIALLIVFSILGAILPQEGQVTSGELARWQFDAPTVTRLAEPIGLFHVFRSWSFVIIITVLTLNTLTCTILHLVRQGGFRDLAGMALVRRVGCGDPDSDVLLDVSRIRRPPSVPARHIRNSHRADRERSQGT